jgi:hypothetical protein
MTSNKRRPQNNKSGIYQQSLIGRIGLNNLSCHWVVKHIVRTSWVALIKKQLCCQDILVIILHGQSNKTSLGLAVQNSASHIEICKPCF